MLTKPMLRATALTAETMASARSCVTSSWSSRLVPTGIVSFMNSDLVLADSSRCNVKKRMRAAFDCVVTCNQLQQ